MHTPYPLGGEALKILVVEDEKMIRQGIVAMIKRSDAEVQEVLDCKNGLEAMELLHTNPVDVVFTDIRMPKMDGIALINKMQELPFTPHVIVISGYEDFNYAVEAMRTGVEDYILKPIDREKINQILKDFERTIKEENENKDKKINVLHQQLKYLLINETITSSELKLIEEEFSTRSIFKDYIVICAELKINVSNVETATCLQDIDGQTVIIVDSQGLNKILKELPPAASVGISRAYKEMGDLKLAYNEAKKARIDAFITGKNTIYLEGTVAEINSIPENYPEQFVQRLGTELFEKDIEKLEFYLFQAQHGKSDTSEWLQRVSGILQLLFHTYGQLIENTTPECRKIAYPLQYSNAEEYMQEFKVWLFQVKNQIQVEFDDHYKREGINQALEYIQKNYSNNLNMAEVSNHISMNYTLFSISFKQHTGINFVNYLKNIRIKEAKRLLESSEEKIMDISRMVGYDNEKHFMKTFKSICGVSPSDYRKNIRLGKKRG